MITQFQTRVKSISENYVAVIYILLSKLEFIDLMTEIKT